MMPPAAPSPFEIERDTRGSLVHVRKRDSGECVGCIEVGLYEIVRSIVEQEACVNPDAKRTGASQ